MDFKYKYLKYKQKYNDLKYNLEKKGGSVNLTLIGEVPAVDNFNKFINIIKQPTKIDKSPIIEKKIIKPLIIQPKNQENKDPLTAFYEKHPDAEITGKIDEKLPNHMIVITIKNPPEIKDNIFNTEYNGEEIKEETDVTFKFSMCNDVLCIKDDILTRIIDQPIKSAQKQSAAPAAASSVIATSPNIINREFAPPTIAINPNLKQGDEIIYRLKSNPQIINYNVIEKIENGQIIIERCVWKEKININDIEIIIPNIDLNKEYIGIVLSVQPKILIGYKDEANISQKIDSIKTDELMADSYNYNDIKNDSEIKFTIIESPDKKSFIIKDKSIKIIRQLSAAADSDDNIVYGRTTIINEDSIRIDYENKFKNIKITNNKNYDNKSILFKLDTKKKIIVSSIKIIQLRDNITKLSELNINDLLLYNNNIYKIKKITDQKIILYNLIDKKEKPSYFYTDACDYEKILYE